MLVVHERSGPLSVSDLFQYKEVFWLLTVVARKEYLNSQRLKGVSLVLVVVVKNYLTDRPTDINLPAKQSGISTLT